MRARGLQRHRLTALALVLALAGCASRAPAPDWPPPTPEALAGPATDGPLDAFLQAQRTRAEQAQAQGRWAEAALAWEVLTLLQPDDAEGRARLTQLRAQIDRRVGEQQSVAQAAQRRGDTDLAVQAWLSVLALDPAHRAAADALRQIERDRSRRSQVGRFARPALSTPRRADDVTAAPATSPTAADAARLANSQREHATLLARQGDLDGAIALLRENAQWRTLPAHRALLADLYVRKAESLLRTQPDAARSAIDAALGIDSRHAAAKALQAQLPAPAGRTTRPPAPSRSTSP